MERSAGLGRPVNRPELDLGYIALGRRRRSAGTSSLRRRVPM